MNWIEEHDHAWLGFRRTIPPTNTSSVTARFCTGEPYATAGSTLDTMPIPRVFGIVKNRLLWCHVISQWPAVLSISLSIDWLCTFLLIGMRASLELKMVDQQQERLDRFTVDSPCNQKERSICTYSWNINQRNDFYANSENRRQHRRAMIILRFSSTATAEPKESAEPVM